MNPSALPDTELGTFWTLLGVLGGTIFYGRFYVQWLFSEAKRRSVIPTAFWYMSMVGSILLLIFGVVTRSPLGTLGQSLNQVVYSRNLIHIWRARGTLTPRINYALNGAVAIVAITASALVLFTWRNEFQNNQTLDSEEATRTWVWLAIGVTGQALFALRFIIQWIATEMSGRSVVPTIFWHLSIVAATLQIACFIQRAEWVFAIGMSATIGIYARNLWFIYHGNEQARQE